MQDFGVKPPRIGILVVAYNAATTLSKTLERIPEDFRSQIAEVLILDDASHDDTFEYGQTWAKRPDTPTTTVPPRCGSCAPAPPAPETARSATAIAARSAVGRITSSQR